MKEICTIGSQVWSVHSPRFDFASINYAFYDKESGEVWGKRVLVGSPKPTTWVYVASPKRSMNMVHPAEWLGGEVPIGLACAWIMGERADAAIDEYSLPRKTWEDLYQ